MSKPLPIRQLEAQTGLELVESQAPDLEKTMLHRYRNSYALDENGAVAALNLVENKNLKGLEITVDLAESLRYLNVSGSEKLKEIIFPEAGMAVLQKAELGECALLTFNLPGEYPALAWLDLRKNQLITVNLPGHYPALAYLDLSQNKLDGAFTLAAGSANLKYLYLNENRLDRIGFEPAMSRLETLQLRGNRLTVLPSGLPRLGTLNVEKNQLTDMEPVLAPLEKGMALLGKDNRWERPPLEIVEKGREAILQYFREIRKGGEEKSLEAKLILIGEGQAGKTSLRTRMLRPKDPLPTKTDRTKGLDIEIERYRFPIVGGEEMRLNIFDFGGQDHYKPLHQFFYSRRALYVLVTKNGDESNDFEFWFDTAQLFGAGSPVLVVNNLFGDVRSQFNRGRYARFDAILKGPVDTNLATLEGWPETRKRIEQLAEILPHVQQFIPKTWANVRRELQARRAENVLPLTEFLQICAKPENGGMDKAGALACSQYLHDIGICLHYQDEETLRKQVIIKNEWATDAVYRVIDDAVIAKNQGQFDWNDLRRIWVAPEYDDLRPELLALMKKFRLCYELPVGQAFIAPTLLPVTPPEGYAWQPKDDLQIFIEYDFMPPGLISQLIVQLHPLIAAGKRMVWRDGVVLQRPNALAEVTLAKRGGKQSIGIRANGPERRELLTYVDIQLDELHKPFGDGLKLEKKIPCNCPVCRSVDTPYYFDLSALENRRKNNRPTIDCEKSFEAVHIETLLGHVFQRKEPEAIHPPEPATPRTIRIFLASSEELKEDRLEFEIFINRQNKYLNPKGIFLHLELWEDFLDAVSPTRLQDEYNRALRDCDILVSLFFTKAGKYTAEEFDTALGQFRATGKPKIFTYFKNAAIQTGAINKEILSLLEFKDRLKEMGHFYTPYDTPDGLKHHFEEQLKKLNIL